MKLHELRPAKGATHKTKRIGRGDGAGHGGTSTKGTKGAQSRTGFKNPHRIEYKVINLGQVEQLAEKYNITEFSLENLYINGLIAQTDRVKVVGNGKQKKKFTFRVNAVSEKAKAAIEAAGGSVEIVK